AGNGSVPRLREVDAAQNAERQAERRRERDQDQRADDRVRHPTADFADRLGQVREEIDVDRRRALPEQEAEDQKQRQDHEARGEGCEAPHEDVDGPPSAGPHSPPTFHPPPTDHTSNRAIAFTTMVSTKTNSPISLSAEQ